ncbi:MAG: ATP-binding protein [Fluviicola sp.]|jgi:serine/threonine-protein kinase RsbW
MKEGYTLIDSLTIPSDVSKLPVVETLIDSVCQSIGVHEDVYGNVLIAVTEAVNNAILHGNKNDVSLNVGVNVFDAPVSFCFNVSDTGNGFDYDSLPDPTAPENIEKENGRGVFLMRNLADDVVYNETGNQVFVYFNKE